MTHHRSRLCQFVIDCDDLDRAVAFWAAALDATEEPLSEQSRGTYRRCAIRSATSLRPAAGVPRTARPPPPVARRQCPPPMAARSR
jgi:hypothetical protein